MPAHPMAGRRNGMSQLLAGIAKANITPHVGAYMAGFANRDHGCEGVHDDLHARAGRGHIFEI